MSDDLTMQKAQTTFAPGPWRLQFIDQYHDDSRGVEVVAETGEVICDNQKYYPRPVTEANARLIAAAPSLYEACKDACVNALGILAADNSDDMKGLAEGIIRGTRAALVKARGDSQE